MVRGSYSDGPQKRVHVQEKVVTLEEHKHFKYDSWEDRTLAPEDEMMNYTVVRIDFSKKLLFADAYTEERFHHKWEHFQEKYRNRDEHFDCWQEHDIEDFGNPKGWLW